MLLSDSNTNINVDHQIQQYHPEDRYTNPMRTTTFKPPINLTKTNTKFTLIQY